MPKNYVRTGKASKNAFYQIAMRNVLGGELVIAIAMKATASARTCKLCRVRFPRPQIVELKTVSAKKDEESQEG